MTAVVPMIKGASLERTLVPGDTLMGSLNIVTGALATVGDGIWTGSAIVSGFIRRTGPTADYADTTDTASNILAAMSSSTLGPGIVRGHSWPLMVQNTVAKVNTPVGGTGVTLGTGVTSIAASLVRSYLVTCTNPTPEVSIPNSVTISGSKVVTFTPPTGMSALPQGGNPGSYNISPGQLVSGTNITAGTLVASVDQGAGGIIGVHLDTVASGSGTQTLTFGPTFRIDGLFSTTL